MRRAIFCTVIIIIIVIMCVFAGVKHRKSAGSGTDTQSSSETKENLKKNIGDIFGGGAVKEDGLSDEADEDGNWYYYKDNEVDTSFTGLAKNSQGWYYVKNGQIDFTANLLSQNESGTWYVKGGQVQFDYSGISEFSYDSEWWYIKDGAVDESYSGMASNENGEWYVSEGKVDFSYTGYCDMGDYLYRIADGVVAGTIDKNAKMVALTYDDGPSSNTTTILDTLEEYGGVATFFLVGERVEEFSDIVSREHSAGCEVANHTWEHKTLTGISSSEIQSQMERTSTAVEEVTGSPTTLMRPPGGAYNDEVKASVGMPIILWSIDTLDWKTRDAQSTINTVMSEVSDGDIVLMHDLYEATANASKSIIPSLAEDGYQLVTVSELAACRGGAEIGEVYTDFYPSSGSGSDEDAQ